MNGRVAFLWAIATCTIVAACTTKSEEPTDNAEGAEPGRAGGETGAGGVAEGGAAFNDAGGTDDAGGLAGMAGNEAGGAAGQGSTPFLGCESDAGAGGEESWTGVARGDDLDDTAIDVAVGSCNNLLVAGVRGEVACVRSYQNAGASAWTYDIVPEAGSVAIGSVLADAEGVAYVVGTVNGQLRGQSSAGGRDLFVTKLDARGKEFWSRQIGSSDDDSALGAALDGHGSLFLLAQAGQLAHEQDDASGYPSVLEKLDASGNAVWDRRLTTAQGRLAADALGNAYVALDSQVQIYDADGADVAGFDLADVAFPVGFSDQDGPLDVLGIAASPNGAQLYVSATLGVNDVTPPDTIVFAVDMDGALVWAQNFGFGNAISDLVASPTGPGVYVVGLAEVWPLTEFLDGSDQQSDWGSVEVTGFAQGSVAAVAAGAAGTAILADGWEWDEDGTTQVFSPWAAERLGF